MNVLVLSIDLFSIGGIQRYSGYVLRALAASPQRPRVAVASLTPPTDQSYEGAPAADLIGGRTRIAKAWFAFNAWRIARCRRADVIIVDHVHLAPIAWTFGLLTRTPYWLNVYAIEVWGPLSFLRRRALLGAAVIVSDCEFTRRRLQTLYPSLRAPIVVVPDCVDVTRFTPDLMSVPPAMPRVLTVARLDAGRSKGHDIVLRALARLRQRGVAMQYIIAGDGPDRARLESLAAELGLRDCVRFLGRVPEDALADVYRSCDIFALVSAFSLEGGAGEGVPLAVIEAQACGKPVITGRDDGSAEAIVDGETGILVDAADVAQVAEALARLASDAPARARMGAAARDLALRRFSIGIFDHRITAVLARFAEVQAGGSAVIAEAA